MKQYFSSAADTAFIAVKKTTEQTSMVRHQLKYTQMGFSHSQLNSATETMG